MSRPRTHVTHPVLGAFVALLVASPAASAEDGAKRPCPPDCPSSPPPEPPGEWKPGFAMRALSLRGSFERTRLGDSDDTAFSVGIEQRALAHLNFGILSARYADFATIGAGNGGIDGGLGADIAFGIRPLLGANHGPVLRLGARGHLLFGGHFRSSLVELPQAQLGYAVIGSNYHVELAARGGVSLVGRYAVDGATSRHLGGAPEYGGYFALGADPLRLEVDFSRIAAEMGRFGALDSVDGLMCAVMEIPTLCLHAQALRGDAAFRGASVETFASYLGVIVGLSAAEWR